MALQYRCQVILVLLIQSLLWLPEQLAAAPSLAKPGCEERCGNISIPYPFGMGAQDCYHDEWYAISCDQSSNPPIPFLTKPNLEVLAVSLERQTVTINNPVPSICDNSAPSPGGTLMSTGLEGSPFFVSQYDNKFMVMGCGNAIARQHGKVIAGCSTVCPEGDEYEAVQNDSRCYGINCCETAISQYPYGYSIDMAGLESSSSTMGSCGSAFLVDRNWSPFCLEDPFAARRINFSVPLVLMWTLKEIQSMDDCYYNGSFSWGRISFGNGTAVNYSQCYCGHNEEGNPYLPNGCQVVEACVNCTNGYCTRNSTESEDGFFSIGDFYCKPHELKSISPLKMLPGEIGSTNSSTGGLNTSTLRL